MCLMFKYGYRNWSYIKFHMLNDPIMKFNFNMKVKTDSELLDRANYLISCFKIVRNKEKHLRTVETTSVVSLKLRDPVVGVKS